MAEEALLPGITEATVETPRLNVHALFAGPEDGEPVMFVHGNVSSSRFWEENMLALGDKYRAIAPDLRGYGDTDPLPIDATRGMRDWSDDLKAFADALNLGKFHIIGWSMGGEVAMQYAIDHPDELLSITLVDPAGPWGHGGTKDVAGTPTFADYAGSGGGTANPEFARLLGEKSRDPENPMGPLATMLTFYFKPPFRPSPERLEVFLSSMNSTRVGPDWYPGDFTTSENWPTVAPGTKGINNAFSPKYCDLSDFLNISPKPPVLWVRGDSDQIVADLSPFEFGFLGQIGAVPGWPGADIYPPQPMIAQLRGFLDKYKAAGGAYWEKVIADAGHSPHVEHPEEFAAILNEHLSMAAQ